MESWSIAFVLCSCRPFLLCFALLTENILQKRLRTFPVICDGFPFSTSCLLHVRSHLLIEVLSLSFFSWLGTKLIQVLFDFQSVSMPMISGRHRHSVVGTFSSTSRILSTRRSWQRSPDSSGQYSFDSIRFDSIHLNQVTTTWRNEMSPSGYLSRLSDYYDVNAVGFSGLLVVYMCWPWDNWWRAFGLVWSSHGEFWVLSFESSSNNFENPLWSKLYNTSKNFDRYQDWTQGIRYCPTRPATATTTRNVTQMPSLPIERGPRLAPRNNAQWHTVIFHPWLLETSHHQPRWIKRTRRGGL